MRDRLAKRSASHEIHNRTPRRTPHLLAGPPRTPTDRGRTSPDRANTTSAIVDLARGRLRTRLQEPTIVVSSSPRQPSGTHDGARARGDGERIRYRQASVTASEHPRDISTISPRAPCIQIARMRSEAPCTFVVKVAGSASLIARMDKKLHREGTVFILSKAPLTTCARPPPSAPNPAVRSSANHPAGDKRPDRPRRRACSSPAAAASTFSPAPLWRATGTTSKPRVDLPQRHRTGVHISTADIRVEDLTYSADVPL